MLSHYALTLPSLDRCDRSHKHSILSDVFFSAMCVCGSWNASHDTGKSFACFRSDASFVLARFVNMFFCALSRTPAHSARPFYCQLNRVAVPCAVRAMLERSLSTDCAGMCVGVRSCVEGLLFVCSRIKHHSWLWHPNQKCARAQCMDKYTNTQILTHTYR